MGILPSGKKKQRDIMEVYKIINMKERGKASNCLLFIHSHNVRTGKHQEVHFHAIIIKQWKSLPQDVIEAKSVKGVQKGIIQINGRESHQRLLNMTFWLQPLAWKVSVLLIAKARRRLIRERSCTLRLCPSICYWSMSETGYWER